MSQATLSSNQSNSYVFKVGSFLGWANSGLDNSCPMWSHSWKKSLVRPAVN